MKRFLVVPVVVYLVEAETEGEAELIGRARFLAGDMGKDCPWKAIVKVAPEEPK